MSGVLVQVSAPGQPSRRYMVRKPEILLGRSGSADIRLDGDQVSRRHCKLVCLGGRWRLADCNSANGVYLDRGGRGAPCLARNDALNTGDQLYIGHYRLTVVVDLPDAVFPEDEATPVVRGQLTEQAIMSRDVETVTDAHARHHEELSAEAPHP